MSQRTSGYSRLERDSYETPAWVTHALIPDLPRMPRLVWECAAGSGNIVRVLKQVAPVIGTDIESGADFLSRDCRMPEGCTGIVSNPPYKHAAEFVDHALAFMEPVGG